MKPLQRAVFFAFIPFHIFSQSSKITDGSFLNLRTAKNCSQIESSAKKNENVYTFFIRSYFGAYKSVYEMEK